MNILQNCHCQSLCLCSQPQLPPASAGNPPTLTDRSGPVSYVVQLLSHVQLPVTPWTAACQASLSFTISWSLLKFMSIESVVPSNHLSHPLWPSSPPALSLSQHQGLFLWGQCFFPWVLVCMRPCVHPPKLEFLFPTILWNSCDQTLLSLLWENFYGIIIFQFTCCSPSAYWIWFYHDGTAPTVKLWFFLWI